MPMRDVLDSCMQALEARIENGPGVTSPERRAAASQGRQNDPRIDGYLEQVRENAAGITDEQVKSLIAGGFSDDELFELTIAAALGAARKRLDRGLACLAAAYDDDGEEKRS
jgi:hypothetical protein